MWDDLTLIVNFVLNTMSSIGSLVLNSILVLSVGLWVLSLVIKLFKKIL